MATSTYLSNPVVTVNSVDLSDQCTAATFTYSIEALESTAFGDTARKYVGGLQSNELTLTMYASFAATESWVTLNSLVGTSTTVIVKPASGADSATNPGLTLTGTFLSALPIAFNYGELGTIDITFTGGVFTADVTP